MLEYQIKRFPELEYAGVEAMNTLCTNLAFAGGDIKKIMVTSCHPLEGKSFVSMNLMRSFAGLGRKVLLIDADIRASVLQTVYGIRSEDGVINGLSSYLAGRCSLSSIIASTDIENADMLLAGRTVINSLPLLSSQRFKDMMDEVSRRYDIIIVDAPPVGTIIDAAKIAIHCDGTLFVVQSGATTRLELQSAVEQIERTNCPILGSVLNKFDVHKYGKKYYGGNTNYNKYYGKYGQKKHSGKYGTKNAKQ